MLQRSLLFVCIFLCVLSGSTAFGQNNQTPASTLNLPRPNTSQGPGIGNLQQSGRETVNLGMGTVSAFLPVLDLPQRGGRSMRLGYVYSNNTWAVKETSVTYNQYGTANASNPQTFWLETYATLEWRPTYNGPFNGSLHLNLPTLQADEMYLGASATGSGFGTTYHPAYCLTNWNFSDWSGASHSFKGFRDCASGYTDPYSTNYWLTSGEASDDSGYRIDLSSGLDPRVIGPDGVVYHFPGYSAPGGAYIALGFYQKPFSSIVDPNNNKISYSMSSRTLTDTMGRQVQLNADDGLSWSVLASPNAAPTMATVTLTQSNSGQSVPFDPNQADSCMAKQPGSYMGSSAQTVGYSGPQVQGPVAPTVYSSSNTVLTLADGSKYTLTFDSNNRLAKITYPSGGYHSYDYGTPSGISNEDDGDMVCNHPHVVALAKHECALANGSCSASPAATISSCQAGNPSGGEATTCVYTYSFSSPSTGQPGVEAHFFPPLEKSRTVYAAGSSTPLQKVETTFSTPSSCPTVVAGGSTVLDGEWCDQVPSATKTTYYAAGSAAGVAEHDVTPRYPGLIDNSRDLDFNGSTVRSTAYGYQTGGDLQHHLAGWHPIPRAGSCANVNDE